MARKQTIAYTYQTTVRLPEDIGAAIEAAADKLGIKASEVIRDAIAAQLGKTCKHCKGTGRES